MIDKYYSAKNTRIFISILFFILFSLTLLYIFPKNALAYDCSDRNTNCTNPNYVCILDYSTCNGYVCLGNCGNTGGCGPCGGGWGAWGCSKGKCSGQQGGFCGYTKKPPIVPKYECRTFHCNTCPTCNATAPVITSVVRGATSNVATINWTPGTNGLSQSLYVGTDKAVVEGNCAQAGCIDTFTGLSPNLNTKTVNNLAAGTVYYWRVLNFYNVSCTAASATSTYLSSCSVTSAADTLTIGQTTTVSTSVNSSAVITGVDYASSNTAAVTVNPASPTKDTTYPYSTTATGVNAGTSTITSNVYGGATVLCSAQKGLTVIAGDPWWQVKDSDVGTGGDISSKVPAGQYFGLAGLGGFAGVPSFGGAASFASGSVSQLGWKANSATSGVKIFDYKYFANQIPSDVTPTAVDSTNLVNTITTGGTAQYGYFWYKFDGSQSGLDLNLGSALNIGSKKVILLVDSADFYIKSPINLTDGQGFFMVIVGKNEGGSKGNIFVDPVVGGGGPNLEGLFVADSQFETGTGNTALYVRGSVAAIYGGVTLQRDLKTGTGNSAPAEFFEYAPDQIMLFPSKFGFRKIDWKEVAP